MRIERLTLDRFGHFTDHEIDLGGGDGVRLVVLLGRNEAGKTTALSALGDLLFGIAARSPFNFRHDYGALRIGADLRAADGRTLTVRRRKGNRNTLLGIDDRPLDDDALDPFLGGADRTVFDGLFGLTHASLRAGGDDMLAAEGDLGRMLFDAGSSMRDIGKVLEALNADAGALFTPRRAAAKPFYIAADACVAAERDLRQATLTVERWRQIESERGRVEAAQRDVRKRLDELEVRRARLERIRRTLSRLGELRQIEAELAKLADAPLMPDDAGERLDRARRGFDVARSRLEREEAAAAGAGQRLAAIAVPQPLLDAEDEIERLYERRGAILDGRTEFRGLRDQRDELEAVIRRLRTDLGGGDRPAPSETIFADVRALIDEDDEIAKQLGDVGERREAAAASLARVDAQLEALAPEQDLKRLAAAVDRAQCLGDIDGALTAAQAAATDAHAALARELATLPLWTDKADTLETLAVPERDTVQRYEREFSDMQMLARGARDQTEKAEKEEWACMRELTALRQGGPLPTAEAVNEAREVRHRGWTLIRRLYISGEAVAESEIEAFAPREHLAERYQQAVREADALADRREAEAQRVARYAQLSADGEAAGERRRRLREETVQAETSLADLREEWRALWRAVGIEPLPPREMELWLARRQQVLSILKIARTTDQALREAEDKLAGACCDLERELRGVRCDVADGHGVADLLKDAKALLEAGSAAAHDRAVLKEKSDSHKKTVDQEQSRLETLSRRRQNWRARWEAATAPLGLPAATSPAAAAVVLRQWEDVRRDEATLAEIERRIARIERDGRTFASEVGQLLAAALPPVTQTDPLAAAELAFRRLKAARLERQTQQEQEAALMQAEQAAADARAETRAARAELDRLQALAGCTDDDALAAAINRSRRKQACTVELETLRRRIAADADGLSLEGAVREADGQDADAVQGEISALKHEIDDLFAEAEQLNEQVLTIRRQSEEMEGGNAAATAEQARRNALADLEECTTRWMEAKTAAFLLRRGIDRFRTAQQGPLLARAERLFSTLTLGSFTRFKIDYDSGDKPLLLGIRANGAECSVDGMSDGTRDQLFLALRLAAIEGYLKKSEPLPFVADDLFVHFDDARATAGLETLIELGAKTQVLLFTHHRHLADLARQAGGDAFVRVQPLAADHHERAAPASRSRAAS